MIPTVRLRRFAFYLYLLLFLCTAPIVVLYTAGYRFDFAIRSFVKTGALSVSTDPRGARIALETDEKLARTPIVVKNIIPGTYLLRLTKDGYHTWEREVTVRSRETAVVEEILLFLDVQEAIDYVVEDAALALSNMPEHDGYAYVSASASWYETWQVNPRTLTQRLVDRVALSPAMTAQTALHLSLYPTLPHYPFTETAEGVLLTKDTGVEFVPVALLPPGTYRAVAETENVVLVIAEDLSRLFVIDTQTEGAPILVNTPIAYFDWSPDGLVYSDGLEAHLYLPEFNQDLLITRTGETILDARLINGHTFLLAFADRVIAYDLSDSTHPVTTTLYEGERIQGAWISENKKMAFIAVANAGSGMTLLTLPLQD